MKILQVCSKTPFPSKDGGSIAMNILTQGLIKCGNEVHVLAISTPKHLVDEQQMDKEYLKQTHYKSVFIDTDVKTLPAFFNLFSNQSYNIIRFYSKEFETVLINILSTNQYDIIHLETLWVLPYLSCIRKYSKAKVVLRSQNIEHLIWQRLADDCSNPIKKWYLKLLAKRLKKYEYGVLNKVDGIAAITNIDAKYYKQMGAKIPIIHIPFGIDLEKYIEDKSSTEYPSLFHIGAMDWMPNSDAIKWFLNSVWDKIYKNHSSVKLYLAGRKMPEWMMHLQVPNVIIEGEVPDSQKFINSKSIMIVPLSSGGGMRVKIIEGMALGKTIIATSIGSEGIDYEDGKNILIANTEEEFVKIIDKCLTDKTFCDRIGSNARQLVEQKYDNFVISTQLSDFYNTLIN